MIQSYVLRDLLHQDATFYPNSLLLKKFLLCVHNGWFQINGCLPDKEITLSDYLFDNERIIFDFTRLSEKKREQFHNWFIGQHKNEASRAFLSGVTTNDNRGYTTEVELGWWDSIINVMYYKKKSYSWSLAPAAITPKYQLNGIELCEGEGGLLIGLNHHSVQFNDSKYHKPEELLRNTKRLLLTDTLVDSLIATNLQQQDYDAMIEAAHPYSIEVSSPDKRLQAMHEYRTTQLLTATKPWYVRLWNRVTAATNNIEMPELKAGTTKIADKNFQSLMTKNFVQVYIRPNNGEILLIEKRPELDSMVFCGGGAKIFGHVGAYKAFEDAQIKATKFAGSSAGAIMAIFCFLGFSADEILHFFQGFRQEILIYYDVDFSGLSDTHSLKAALDYMITKKINQIIKDNKIEESEEGKQFLVNCVFPTGKITFESLKSLKTRYPDCGLGDELVITATNVTQQETHYFSYAKTPAMEVSLAGTMSASMPVVFKPIVFEGEIHCDGGVLNNLPTNVFRDDGSTLLESEHGNRLNLVVFQFDNGIERKMLDTLVHKVYRENFVLDWIYGVLTGVKDTVSGWEKDRLKLIQYSNQVVLIPVNNVSATQFDMDKKTQEMLFESGYQAAKNYITIRYEQQPENAKAVNEEYLYSTFSSIEEVLFYCCYRGREDWFDNLIDVALEHGVTREVINKLKNRHFEKQSEPFSGMKQAENPSFSSQISSVVEETTLLNNMRLFELMYPIFLKLPSDFITTTQDLKLFKAARHALSLNNPFKCVECLLPIKGEIHILLAVLIRLLDDFNTERTDLETTCARLAQFEALKMPQNKINLPSYYGNWQFFDRHISLILDDAEKGQWQELETLCEALNPKAEPLKTVETQTELPEEPQQATSDIGIHGAYGT